MKLTKQIIFLSLILLPLFATAQDNVFLKKYSGNYQMLVDGQKDSGTPDQYVFTPNGKCEWAMTFKNDQGKMEVKKTPGTWTASEGLIQMKFDMGEGEGSELISEFHLKDGVFHSNENVYLKKIVSKIAPKPAPKTTQKASPKK